MTWHIDKTDRKASGHALLAPLCYLDELANFFTSRVAVRACPGAFLKLRDTHDVIRF